MGNLPIKTLVIHCSATPEGQWVTRDEIKAWHKAKGWSDIGYHWVIYLDGTMVPGRQEGVVGAHVEGHNQGSLGIVYVGGTDKDGKAKDTRTDNQKAALAHKVRELLTRYPTITKICGHRDYSPDLNHDGIIEPNEYMKECPSFDVGAWAKAEGLGKLVTAPVEKSAPADKTSKA